MIVLHVLCLLMTGAKQGTEGEGSCRTSWETSYHWAGETWQRDCSTSSLWGPESSGGCYSTAIDEV